MKKTIEDMYILAEKKGIKFLSTEYLDTKTKLLWECKKGHQWMARSNDIQSGYSCPECAGTKKLTIEKMQQIALDRGGWCLSPEYFGVDVKLWWQCGDEHVFESAPNNVKNQNSWCPKCGGTGKLTIEDMHELAERFGGKFLSLEYLGNKYKHEWECKEGHVFKARANDVDFNHWCPECSDKLSERICRAYFELMFKEKFPSKWPKWLLNEKGNKMELDGYSEKFGIAFEYQGKQHFKKIFDYHNVEKQQDHDFQKQKLCKEKNIKLITIPYTIKYREIQKYIIDECKKQGIVVPDDIQYKDYQKLNVFLKDRLERYQKLAKEKGGKCLSERYIHSKKKLKFQCGECGHIWEATPSTIKRYWCPKCGVKRRVKIQLTKGYNDFIRIVEEKKGTLLSDYIGSKIKLHLRCEKGHDWWVRPNNIMRGYWCPECVRKKKGTIEQMQELAKYKGGKCLSIKYINRHTKLKWKCADGHIWEAVPSSIIKGHWCRVCYNRKRRPRKYNRNYKGFPHKHAF